MEVNPRSRPHPSQFVTVSIHERVRHPPRMVSPKDIILFAQTDVEIPSSINTGDMLRVLVPTDTRCHWNGFHEYSLVFPLKGTEASKNLTRSVVTTNTFDEDVSCYIMVHHWGTKPVIIKAGEPFARLVLDCAQDYDKVRSQSDSLALRAEECGPHVYRELDYCPVVTSSRPLDNFRRPLQPTFLSMHEMLSPGMFINDKFLNMDVFCADGTKHLPVWVAEGDVIFFTQRDTYFQDGDNWIDLGGFKVDCCEPLTLEYPIYNSSVGANCGVQQVRLKRMQDVTKLKIVWNKHAQGIPNRLVRAGTPIARLRSAFRMSLESIRFTSLMAVSGEELAVGRMARSWRSLRFYIPDEEQARDPAGCVIPLHEQH